VDEAGRRHQLKIVSDIGTHTTRRLHVDSKALLDSASKSLLQGLEAASVGPEVCCSNLLLCSGATAVNLKLVLPLRRELVKWKLTPAARHLGDLCGLVSSFDIDDQLK